MIKAAGSIMEPEPPKSNPRTLAQRLAKRLADSIFFRRGQRLWEANTQRWNFPLSKWEKLLSGGYVILKDYAEGVFPPKFEDQAEAYRNEIEFNTSLPGHSLAESQKSHSIKPFWGAAASTKYLGEFNRVYSILQAHGLKPGDRLLELGCGSGWMAELFALAGFSVLGTTISHHDIEIAERKVKAIKCKELAGELTFDLKFLAWPMESIDKIPDSRNAFDGVYVFEALHHAFDWRKALHAAANTLKSGGWLLLANEPNQLHTCISYRVAKLSNTHEIGFSRRELVRELTTAGFPTVKVLSPRFDNWVSHQWIIAQKG